MLYELLLFLESLKSKESCGCYIQYSNIDFWTKIAKNGQSAVARLLRALCTCQESIRFYQGTAPLQQG